MNYYQLAIYIGRENIGEEYIVKITRGFLL